MKGNEDVQAAERGSRTPEKGKGICHPSVYFLQYLEVISS